LANFVVYLKTKAVLRFLLIFLLIILVIRFLNRLFFSSYGYTNERPRNESRQTHKEGSVTLEKNPKDTKRFNKNDGEYVDYEEVK